MGCNRYSLRDYFMSIEYTYEVVSVDEAAKCMEIVYTAQGRETLRIGARLPYVGESFDAVVAMYAPLAYWMDSERQVVAVSVGSKGVVRPDSAAPATLEEARTAKCRYVAQRMDALTRAPITVGAYSVSANLNSLASALLAYTALKEGLVPSADFRTANGSTLPLGLDTAKELLGVLTSRVQQLLAEEQTLLAAVTAANSIAELDDPAAPFNLL